MTKNGKAPDINVSLVRAHYDESFGSVDTSRREIHVDIDIRSGTLVSDDLEYTIGQSCSIMPYPDGPTKAVISLPRWGVRHYGRIVDLEDARAMLKHLEAAQRYLKSLPLQPRALADFALCFLAMHKVERVKHLIAYPDHKSRPDLFEEDVTVGRVARVIEEEVAKLAPENMLVVP